MNESLITKSDIAKVKRAIELMVRTMTIRFALMMVAAAAILVAIKFF